MRYTNASRVEQANPAPLQDASARSITEGWYQTTSALIALVALRKLISFEDWSITSRADRKRGDLTSESKGL